MPKYVDFTSPPVSEVVFGFIFESPTRLLSAHFGAFWSGIRDGFPKAEDQQPLFSVGAVPFSAQPLSRVWFISKDDRRLIQIQQDRFYFNWRRLEGDPSEYPNYDTLFAEFLTHLNKLYDFLKAERLIDELRASSFELTYINILQRPKAWTAEKPLGDLLVDHNRKFGASRFLSEPRDFSWSSVYDLPPPHGQLLVEAKSGSRTDSPENRIVQLTLTARSDPSAVPGYSIDQCPAWFEVAHRHIVKGFEDTTDPEIQSTEWGKK